jgi:hypothetical protein
MKRAIVLTLAALCVLASPALADMSSNRVYYNTASALYTIPDITQTTATGFVGDHMVGSFNIGSQQMTDIAFDTDGTLYGVSFNNLYTINTTTGVATNKGPGVYPANALANYDTGKFYAAIDGTSLSGFNGYFYSVDVSTNTWSQIGRYTDASGTQYLSGGDIWVTDEAVYAIINNGNNTQSWLATVNPANALVSNLIPLGPADMYGLTGDAAGELLVYRATGDIYKIQGGALVDTGHNTIAGAYGATAVPVPLPASILLGAFAVGLAGRKLRKSV